MYVYVYTIFVLHKTYTCMYVYVYTIFRLYHFIIVDH